MNEAINVRGEHSKLLGILLLAVNSALWIYLLYEITRVPLPVNCAGAWPENMPLIVFIQLLLWFPIIYVKGKTEKTVNPVTATLIMLDVISLLAFLVNSLVSSYCICTDPSIIWKAYKTATFFYVVDSAVKTYLYFSTPQIGTTENKKE